MSASALLAEVHEDAANIWRKLGAVADELAHEAAAAAPAILPTLEAALGAEGIPGEAIALVAAGVRALAAKVTAAPVAPAIGEQLQADNAAAHPVPEPVPA